jgi:multicomponent K+:H+ antiporter subunit D
MPWIWGTILGTTLIAVLGFARAGSLLFWKSAAFTGQPARGALATPPGLLELLPVLWLLALLGALTAGAGTATVYGEALAAQLFAPTDYVEAVLGRQGRP